VVVRPIFVDEVGRFNAALTEHHWLGHRLTGAVLRYVAVLDGEWVAVVGFGSAVLSCRARDEFLGWSREQQYARLKHVANNQRFCVLPAGRRPNLASAVLSRVLARLSRDYLAAYGHRVLAVETFTDPARHTGACYAAANFQQSGPPSGTPAPRASITITDTPSGYGCIGFTATRAACCPRRFPTRC
jgi:GNAT superfamily N-acetyltransferase